jgi:CheY-like chemotaxis protein
MIKKGKEGRILVIDDEEPVRKVLSKILSQVNHQVKVTRNGEEGIQLVKEKEFDIVLTDLGMPGISGWEVCKIVKKMYPHLPVGMITGWGMELDQEKVEETGVDFVVSKPFDFNQILQVVAETMELKGKRFLS